MAAMSTAAARMRTYRARLRAGVECVVRIAVTEEVVEALILPGPNGEPPYLDPASQDDRMSIAAAVERVLADLVKPKGEI